MKNRRISILAVLLFCLIAVNVSGCGSGTASVIETTFQLHEDGSVTHTIIDSYSDSFTEEELASYISEQVSSYVKNTEEPEITLESCGIENGNETIKIVMKYASVADYAEFNHVRAFTGWLQDAYKKGCSFSSGFVTNTGTYLPGYLLPVEYPDLNVLVLQEPMKVILPQKPILTSENVTANNDGSYSVLQDQTDAVPTLFQSVNNNPAYLVYTVKS